MKTRWSAGMAWCLLCLFLSVPTSTLPHEFALTTGSYSANGDLQAAIEAEFGPGAQVADFAEIKSRFAGQIGAFCDSVGLTGYRSNAICLRNGQDYYRSGRHYFLERHNGSVPGGWAVHDQIDANTLDLGSWYNITKRVLVKLPQDQDGDGYALSDGDCDDTNPAVHPQAPDACGDGVDADCDGQDPICPVADRDQFVLSSGRHGETEDLQAVVEAEYGPQAAIADFVELKALFTGQAAALADALGLANYRDGAICLRDGAGFYAGYRHYFLERHDGAVPGGWTVHDQIDANTLSLGSWYNISKPILIRLPYGIDADHDGDGYSIRDGDRSDGDPTIHPGAPEVCNDGIDQDCDGEDLVCARVPQDFGDIQGAIDAALPGDTILVAPATYAGPGNTDIHFHGKALTLRCDTDDGPCVISGESLQRGFTFDQGEGPDTRVIGFTVTGGQRSFGGGIYVENASPTLIDCTLEANRGLYAGGGLYVRGGSPHLSDCVIRDNRADDAGGVYLGPGSNAVFENCTIQGNHANYTGGGVYSNESTPTFERCDVLENRDSAGAAGLYLYASDARIVNSVIARSSGSGIHCLSSSPTIVNSTIANNWCYRCGGIVLKYGSSPRLVNSIVWANSSLGIDIHSGSPQIEHCDLQDGPAGSGGISADPLFVDPAAGDYRLTEDSPCIDAGNGEEAPTQDREGVSRPQGGGVDMGAYESH